MNSGERKVTGEVLSKLTASKDRDIKDAMIQELSAKLEMLQEQNAKIF